MASRGAGAGEIPGSAPEPAPASSSRPTGADATRSTNTTSSTAKDSSTSKDKGKGEGDGGGGFWRPLKAAAAVGGAAAVGVLCSMALGSGVHKHVVKEEVKLDTSTGEVLVTDPAMKVEVKRGDTLYSIARQCDVTVAELRAANNIKGDKILAGSSLFIPGVLGPAELDDED